MSPTRRYSLWGFLLGMGTSTLIPYSSFVLLIGAQLTSGIIVAALSGLVYGVAREGVAVGWSTWHFQVEGTIAALEKFRGRAQMLDITTIVFGAIVLVFLPVVGA